MLHFDIVHTNAPPILGLRACLDLKMIKLIHMVGIELEQPKNIIDEFADVF